VKKLPKVNGSHLHYLKQPERTEMRRYMGLFRSGLLLFFILYFSISASAERNVGMVAGISASPNQFYVGGHVMAGQVTKDLWFKPNFEVGFGNSSTLVGLNGEFAYMLSLTKSEWTPYVGAGPALVIQSFHHNTGNDSHVGPGFNFLGGVRKKKGVFAEVKAGALDSPSFKLGIGYTF
jgi:hypothetical protein